MDDVQRQTFKEKLVTELEATRLQIERLEVVTKPIAPDKALGRLTRMEGLSDKGISEAALNQAREKLYRLEQSIEAVDREGFGLCLICHQAIPFERLLAMPETRRCVQCASKR